MTPVPTDTTTRILDAPDGWDPAMGECVGLPISDYEGVMYSYWQPSFRQRIQILLGRRVRLCVAGCKHPPVAVDTLT